MTVADRVRGYPLTHSVYVYGVRDDLDAWVRQIRYYQVLVGARKLCPACGQVKSVEDFVNYGDRVCAACRIDPMVIATRYGPVSYIPPD